MVKATHKSYKPSKCCLLTAASPGRQRDSAHCPASHPISRADITVEESEICKRGTGFVDPKTKDVKIRDGFYPQNQCQNVKSVTKMVPPVTVCRCDGLYCSPFFNSTTIARKQWTKFAKLQIIN